MHAVGHTAFSRVDMTPDMHVKRMIAGRRKGMYEYARYDVREKKNSTT